MCQHEKEIRLLEEANRALNIKFNLFISQYKESMASQGDEHKQIIEQLTGIQKQLLEINLIKNFRLNLKTFLKEGEALIQEYNKEKEGLGLLSQKTMQQEAQRQEDLYYKEQIEPKMYL